MKLTHLIRERQLSLHGVMVLTEDPDGEDKLLKILR